MVLIKSISKCGQCTKSTCKSCSNYISPVIQAEDTDNARVFVNAVSFVCLIVILLIVI